METVARLFVAAVMALVGVFVVTLGPAPLAEAQTDWSKVALGSEGHDVVLDEARGVLYVSLPDARKVTVVDTSTGTILRDILLGEMPAGMDLSPDGGHLYVALLGVGSVAVIDLADDSVEAVSVEAELGSNNAWNVYVVDDSRFLVSGAGFWIVLVDQADSSQTRVASNAGPIPCAPEFTGNVGDDFVYLAEGGCSPNSLYKVDLTQPSMPVVAEDNHGNIDGAEQAKVSRDGSRIYLSTQIVSTLDFLPIDTTPVKDSFPAPLEDGRVAFVSDSGGTVRVVNDANQVVLTRSTSCEFVPVFTSFPSRVGGLNATADSSVIYFEAGGSLCAVSIAPVPCGLATVVSNQDDLNTAINCFNAQSPPGDHTITLGASFELTYTLTPVTLDSPGTRLTIMGDDNVLTKSGVLCCETLVMLEGSSDLYLERLLLEANGQLALTVGADAGEVWVIDAGIVGSVDVEGGTFVLLRSVLRDSSAVGINATGGIVSVFRSLIVDVPSPIVSSADILAVGYSIINGSASNVAIRAVGSQLSDVEILGSVIFDAKQGVVLDGANTSSLIVNSTLWNNGVGVRSYSGDVTVTNSMIALGDSGVVASDGDVTVVSSILVNDADCSEPFSGTNNFSQASTCGAGFTQLTNDDFDRFGTLDDHGCTPQVETPWGCTSVVALLDGHSAIGAGKCDDVRVRYDVTGPLEIDQREVARVPSKCDAGAFESSFVARCNGLAVTINMNLNGGNGVGTPGNDVILGTSGNDVIDALGGDDTVCAGAGDDTVVGGDGDDTMFGGAGRDVMRGNAGVDVIDGGAGNDRLLGGIGGDTLTGGLGDDYLGGFGGADTINGGSGNETIFGGFGADTIDGGSGDDVIRGLIGNDTINGGPGNDELFGDRGQDTIRGGAGDDTIGGGNAGDQLFGDDGNDTIAGGKADDTLSGGLGADTCAGNKHFVADTADDTCETLFSVP